MKITYVGRRSANDIRHWSGTPYWIVKRLREAGHQIAEVIVDDGGIIRYTAFPERLLRAAGVYIAVDRLPMYQRWMSRKIAAGLDGRTSDVVLCENSVLASKARHPNVVFWADAELSDLYKGYWPKAWKGWLGRKAALRQESSAIENSATVIYSSRWARESSARKHPAFQSRMVYLPFMANMEMSQSDEEVIAAIERRDVGVLKLLFSGVDWKRKGGDRALALAEELRKLGLAVELNMLGAAVPAGENLPSYAKDLGFLDKAKTSDLSKIRALLLQTDFFVLPSRADCSPLVLVEALAFGVPAITTSVGGIPDIIVDDDSGIIDPFTDIPSLALRVKYCYENRDCYTGMAKCAYDHYKTRFSPSVCLPMLEAALMRTDTTSNGRVEVASFAAG